MLMLPKRMIFEVTRRCNYNCPYCYCIWNERPEFATHELDTAEWKGIIDRCVDEGVCDILFTGGEPIARQDVFELLSYARRKGPGIRLEIYTNGSLVTETVLRRLKRMRVRLSTSLPGLASYGAMTGTRRTYRHVLEMIARAAELNWPVSVGVTVTSVNADEVENAVAAAIVSGAGIVQIAPVMAEGRCRRRMDLMLSRRKWNSIKARIGRLPGRTTVLVFCDEMLCDCRPQPPFLRRSYALRGQFKCPAGRDFSVIGPDGRMRRCLHSLD